MFSDKTLLDTAKQSPLAVAAHDKAAWLNLFARDAQVHDPVGSRGHAGDEALGRFYDTFIAPNNIRFEVEHDIVCGQSVVRDLVISTRMGGTPLQVDVPLFIRYHIVDEAGQPRIRRLYAHWELLPMMTGQVFNQGVSTGLLALIKLSGNMLHHQGLSGALGFSRAFIGAGAQAKARSEQCLAAIAQADTQQLKKLLPSPSQLQWGEQNIAADELVARLPNLRWEKVLAGGQYVTARLLSPQIRAVALFDFSGKGKQIERLRIYANTSPATT